MRRITSRVWRKNRVLKTQVLIADMGMFLPHGTRVLKTRVLEKQSSEDDDEDEKPKMKGKMK